MLSQPGEQPEDLSQSVGLVERKYVRLFDGADKLNLECGRSLGPIDVAYETYGQLNEKKDNAILITHALSGDAHVAGRPKKDDRKPGWWDNMVGPGKPFDTSLYFVICSNCLGGCMGTTGPSSLDPQTGRPYGLSFPMITISDMVEVQQALLDYLGIEKLLAVAGGSMGGMQVLDWAIRYPQRVAAAIPIATTSRLSAQGIAFDAVGRNAILTDQQFQEGMYYQSGKYPSAGLAVARMVGHITYLSEEAMHAKFGRRLQRSEDYQYEFSNEFSVESYLDHQGSSFVDRFDANTYLYFSKAMDYFDLPRQYGDLDQAMSLTQCRFLVLSYHSDWLFPPRQSQDLVDALMAQNKEVTYCNINCPFGHDSFLLETEIQGSLLRGFLAQTHRQLQSQKDPKPKPLSPVSQTARSPKAGSIFAGGRVDHLKIAQLIRPDSRVLDLGCGNGDLLQLLQQEKNIKGTGSTLNVQDIVNCCRRGIDVVQYDLNQGLHQYDTGSYDYVVLSQALQVVKNPELLLREMLRVGKQVIVSFPNFAYWKGRFQLLFHGQAPVWKNLSYNWYDKPEESVNYMSILDFEQFVRQHLQATLVRRIPLSSYWGREMNLFPNLLADEAIFVISKEHE